MLRIRLVSVGRERNQEITTAFPEVTQLCWAEMLAFIWHRFRRYRQQKTQVDQWDLEGRKIKCLADRSHEVDFIAEALRLMGIRIVCPNPG